MKTNDLLEEIKLEDNERSEIEIKDPATKLVIENIDFEHTDTLIEYFSPTGSIGIISTRRNPKINVVEVVTNIRDFEAVSENLKNNQVKHGQVLYPNQINEIGKNFDIAIIRTILEKRKKMIIDMSLRAMSQLKPDGYLLIVGAKKEGVQSVSKYISKLTSSTSETMAFKHGIHLIRLKKPDDYIYQNLKQESIFNKFEVRGLEIDLKLDERVFAKGKLDLATKLLIENVEVEDGSKILDLGCGSGVIGIAISKLGKNIDVTYVDDDYAATEVTKDNLIKNDSKNFAVFLSNEFDKIKERKFDLIVSNPPFHLGKQTSKIVASEFIKKSYFSLSPKGKLYIVCNAFLPYEKSIKNIFGNCEIVARTPAYKLLMAKK